MGFAYGIGGLIKTSPPPVKGSGVPPTSFKGQLGQIYFDTDTSPPSAYIYNGATWVSGGNSPATTTTFGTVILNDSVTMAGATDENVPTSLAIKTYVDNTAIAGAPSWSETVSGIGQLSTTAEATAGTNDDTAMTPLKVAQVFASPPATGSSTPAAGSFTTLSATGLASLSGSATITTGATALNLASDASTGAVNIGTGSAARTITIGNVTGATAVAINTGTGSFAVTTTGTGDITFDSDDTMLLDADGILEINSSAGVISIGNDAISQDINLGTGGDRTITLGNSTGATSVVIESGTGPIDIGTNAIAHNVSLGNNTGATAVSIESGSGGLDIGSAATAQTITIGNVTGTTAISMLVGTGNFALNGVGASTYNIGAATTSGTVTIGGTSQTGNFVLGPSDGAMTANIVNGAGAKTINLGSGVSGNTISVGNGINTSAQTVSIANGASAADSTVNILSGLGTAGAAVLSLGNNTRVTTIGLGNIAPAAARTTTISGGDSAQNDTVNILAGAPSAGTQSVNILTGTSSGGTQTLNLGAAACNVNIDGIVLINDSINANVSIASGTSTGAVVIGNASAGALSMDTAASISLDSATASNFTVTGAEDLTLSSTAGSVIISGGEAVADAVSINAAAGGVDVDCALQFALTSSQAAADAILLTASNGAGGITLAAGTAGVTLSGDTGISGDTTVTGDLSTTGNLILSSVASYIQLNGGAATDFIGTATLSAGTVTVANTNIGATDRILISRRSINASSALGELTYSISAATSFTITSVQTATPASTQTNDQSIVDYVIIRQN